MQARFKGKLVEVWKNSHLPIYEPWVKNAFEQALISWNEKNQNVLNFSTQFEDLALVGDVLLRKETGEFQVICKGPAQEELTFLDRICRAKLGHTIVEVWKISTEEPKQEWVRNYFAMDMFCWEGEFLYLNGVWGKFRADSGFYVIHYGPKKFEVVSEKNFLKNFRELDEGSY